MKRSKRFLCNYYVELDLINFLLHPLNGRRTRSFVRRIASWEGKRTLVTHIVSEFGSAMATNDWLRFMNRLCESDRSHDDDKQVVDWAHVSSLLTDIMAVKKIYRNIIDQLFESSFICLSFFFFFHYLNSAW